MDHGASVKRCGRKYKYSDAHHVLHVLLVCCSCCVDCFILGGFFLGGGMGDAGAVERGMRLV